MTRLILVFFNSLSFTHLNIMHFQTSVLLLLCVSGTSYASYSMNQNRPHEPTEDPFWWMFMGDTIRNERNRCRRLVVEGSCDFYSSCFHDDVSNCEVKPVLEQYCRNSEKQAEFNKPGSNYIDNVRKCQTQKLWEARNSRKCEKVDKQSLQTLVPTDGVDKTCLNQSGFCDIIANEQNCQALFNIFNLSQPAVWNLSTQLFDYFLQLSQQCSIDIQITFFQNFFMKLTSTTTTPAPTMPMMMGNGD